jgi:RNA methyltransferase, TrmH family
MARAQTITSAANPLIKDVRRALARGSLTEEGLCLAETFHLLDEALRSKCEVRHVLAAESAQAAVEEQLGRRNGVRLAVLPDALFQTIAGTQTTQGVLALVQPPEWTQEQLFRGTPLVAVLDGVQDPGNAGTIARTAEAFGVSGMLLLKGTVSPWNPKVLRASAGSMFRVPFIQGLDAVEARELLQRRRVGLFAGVPAGTQPPARAIAEADLTGSCALVIGSEAQGVSAALRSSAIDVSIPTVGVESLNAAVAAAILLYEARRQRMRS